MTDKLVSLGTFLKLPFIGDDLVKPLTTDLSAGQLLQLGWIRFRSNEGRSLHCRLGGEPQSIGGESVIVGGEENSATLADVHRPVGTAAAPAGNACTAPAAGSAGAVRAVGASSGAKRPLGVLRETDPLPGSVSDCAV